MFARRFGLPLLLLAVVAILLPAVGRAQEPAPITVAATAAPQPIDPLVLGTNLPAWLGAERLDDPTFRARTVAAGITLVRVPGGSWSNDYDWLACERDGVGIDANAECYWPWAARPTDFLNFLRATGLAGMYTVNANGTPQEAAALVAFFNGSVDDDRVIGRDGRGRDWGRVSDWAGLRRDHGNPEPLPIRYWEIGNEIYGGKEGMGTDCLPWGWENVWTCDGAEYVRGTGQHEGYLAFRRAMQAVDPTIAVGAVGVPVQSDWSNWGNEVIAAAGDVMDFYVVHQYAFFEPPQDYTAVLQQPTDAWSTITADVRAAFAAHANGRDVPIAVTEHNLFSVQEQDNGQWMTRAVNALFMADTLGQMMQHGIDLANQWDLANGAAGNGTDYGLLAADGFARAPQYYAFPLWARFGNGLLPVTSSLPPVALSVYAGQSDAATRSLLVINKTADAIAAQITLDGVTVTGGTVDVAQAASLDAQTMRFNGVADPADDLADAPPQPLQNPGNPLSFTFAPYAITLLRLQVTTAERPPLDQAVYLPTISGSRAAVVAAPLPAVVPATVIPAGAPPATEETVSRPLLGNVALLGGGVLLLGVLLVGLWLGYRSRLATAHSSR